MYLDGAILEKPVVMNVHLRSGSEHDDELMKY